MLTAETIISTILQQMSGISKCRRRFFMHIVGLYLSMRTRYSFCNFARYGCYSEQSYRNNFGKDFNFKDFNRRLIQQHCSRNLALVFDASYLSKSGKSTPGVGYFWSGCAGAMKWGVEIGGIAVADVDNHTAMHYHAVQTPCRVEGEGTLLSWYAKNICGQAKELQKMSQEIVADAFFSKYSFVESLCSDGFTLISRMQKNAVMRYRYLDPQKSKGRPKLYDGNIDPMNVSLKHFDVFRKTEEEIVYEGIAHIRSLKRWCKVVIVQTLKEGKPDKANIYFSTETTMTAERVMELYRLRFQIEFLYRDAKTFLGLNHSQSRQKEAMEYHYNISLTTLNIAKAAHWLSLPKQQRRAFSMADIKTKYINELLLDRIISIYGKDPNVEKNNPEIAQLYQLGTIAA